MSTEQTAGRPRPKIRDEVKPQVRAICTIMHESCGDLVRRSTQVGNKDPQVNVVFRAPSVDLVPPRPTSSRTRWSTPYSRPRPVPPLPTGGTRSRRVLVDDLKQDQKLTVVPDEVDNTRRPR